MSKSENINVRVSPEMKGNLENIAELMHWTLSEVVESACQEYLEDFQITKTEEIII